MTLNLVFLVKQKSVTWSKAIDDASNEARLRVTEMHASARTSLFKEKKFCLKVAVFLSASKPKVMTSCGFRTVGIGEGNTRKNSY